MQPTTEKIPLLGMNIAQLKEVAQSLSFPSFIASQICDWLYNKRISEISEMTNLSLERRALLAQQYTVGRSVPLRQERSADGTGKYLFAANNGRSIETVVIPDGDRTTACLSSQCGCRYACSFCMTGKQGFGGNLTAAQILNQLFSVAEASQIDHAVFMGMGEPLDNCSSLLKVMEILTSRWGLDWSPKRITLSTVGKLDVLPHFLSATQVHLAVSLHAASHNLRQQLMPVEKLYPIQEVVDCLRQYDWTHQRRLSFEYILMDGVNDSPVHLRQVASLLKDLPCRINLIRYHSIPGLPYRTSSEETMLNWRNRLTDLGFTSTIRASRGEDIMAACGMLSGKDIKDKS